ncbi:hypothetical protein TSOC_002074 [Tetrabaena socialis]|uniref:Uncharacterized protein n=1 Tax=Tetrabaena socialis TaxID=47790 RepID=A0A2J8AEZ6_9CHLO|nr:hypothetical protein TSOC_002074 [Tetrabaena socialis]|eukprot:PNH11095.1 hypothetical protein TSOC_002074 [Tetrabaena socialis]
MFATLARVLRAIVLAPWHLLRLPLLQRATTPPPPSARAKARLQAQKAQPAPQAPPKGPPKPKKMDPSRGEAAPSEEKSKLDEQATGKASHRQPGRGAARPRPAPPAAVGELSYSYWAGKTSSSPAAVPEPKKLSEAEKAELERAAAAHGASAWNAVGGMVYNFCSDDPDDLDVQPEVGHRQPERAADEAAALAAVRAALRPALAGVLASLLEELRNK